MTRLVTRQRGDAAAAPRAPTGVPVAASAAAIANHSFEWSAAAVSAGIDGVQQRAGGLRDGLEHLAVQGAQPAVI